jgi:polyhydroxybutyrate depolymerase
MKKLLLLLLCLPMIGFGQQTFNFMHNGLNREYIYYAPANLPVDAPLVFVAHGFTGSAQGIMSYCGMNTIADQNSFAVCYPQGTTDSWGDNFWNVGYNFHAGVTIDDVDFIVSLASYLQSTYQLSAINTFFTGMSNGGELSYLLACEGPNVFRAFAPVAGTIFPNGLTNNICSPIVPVSIFETHGRNDNVTLIEGDLFDQYWGPYLSIDTIINFWVAQNSLTNLVVDTFPNLNNNNKITISYKYSDPSTNNEVWLYTHKSGHNWGDDGDMVIEQEIWNFFSQMSFTAPSWDCVNNACIDPGTGTGMYLNLTACTSACVVSAIEEYATNRELLKVTDLLGREAKEIKNTLLFYIYNDGTVEQKIILE